MQASLSLFKQPTFLKFPRTDEAPRVFAKRMAQEKALAVFASRRTNGSRRGHDRRRGITNSRQASRRRRRRSNAAPALGPQRTKS